MVPPPGRAAVDVLLAEDSRILRWEEIFGRRAPVEVEVGSGKGRFLLGTAATSPERNFLGIERRVAHLGLCARRAVGRGLTNVRLLRADASEVLWGRIPAGTVSVVHVYYPDPWWKARHKKRRVFSAEFVVDVARVLVSGGELRVVTDVGEYFERIVETLAQGGLFDRVEAPGENFGSAEEPLTSYQAKYARQGRSIHGALFIRSSAAPPGTPDPRERLRILRESRRKERIAEGESTPAGKDLLG